MAITLYHAPMSSASPIVWIMEELGIEHTSIQIDLKEGKHKQPEFLALNPMGQVPTLIDGEQAMFEGVAITIHLGDCYGVERNLWPAVGTPERMRALSWLQWMAVTVGATLRQVFTTHPQFAPPELQHPALNAHASKRLVELWQILDAHLADRNYIATPDFCLTDAYTAAGMKWIASVIQFDLQSTPNVAAWLERCTRRPAAAAMA